MESRLVRRLQRLCSPSSARHASDSDASSGGKYQSIEAELMTSATWPPVSRSGAGLAELMRLETEATTTPPDDAPGGGGGSTRPDGYTRLSDGRRSRTVSELSYDNDGTVTIGADVVVDASDVLLAPSDGVRSQAEADKIRNAYNNGGHPTLTYLDRMESAEDSPLVGNDHMTSTRSRGSNDVNTDNHVTAL